MSAGDNASTHAGSWVLAGVRPLGGEPTDVYVENGVLVDAEPVGAQRLDAGGLVALPGLVDLHTHLREPGREDAETVETGTLAAALGGFTAVHAMANTEPVADVAGGGEQGWGPGPGAGPRDGDPGRAGDGRPPRGPPAA